MILIKLDTPIGGFATRVSCPEIGLHKSVNLFQDKTLREICTDKKTKTLCLGFYLGNGC